MQRHLNEAVPNKDEDGKPRATEFSTILESLGTSLPARRLLVQFALLWLVVSLPFYLSCPGGSLHPPISPGC
ncbi:MAG: hypothetical protein R3E31_04505 [Chloroflexota bacterium]